ncbi:MAG: hypothetical protein IPK93_10205 [Solirubrobacterales bacterium]|nr:hypothetical protein [Solirubrobacterales bacterium]
MSKESFFYPAQRILAGRPCFWASLTFVFLALMTFGSGVSTAMAGPQGGWQAPATDVSGIEGTAAAPQVATSPDGSVTVVWVGSDGANDVVQAATREPGYPFSAPAGISTPGADAEAPQLAIAPDGTVIVLWQRGEGVNQLIQSSARPPGGHFSAPENLTAAGQAAHDPQVAVGPDGAATGVWVRGDVVQSATRQAGGAFGSAANLSADGQVVGEPRIAIGADGTAVAVWTRNDGVNDIVQAATRPSGSGFGSAADLTPTGQDATNPQIAIAPDGTATAIWRRNSGIAQHEIQVATQPPGGSFGSETTLSVPGENGGDPLIVVAPDGTATAVWYHVSEPTTFVRSAARPPDGTFSAPEDLTSNTTFAQQQQVAVGPDGTVTVVWQIYQDLKWKVQATTRTPGGTFEGATDISAPGSGDFRPQVSMGPDGRATAAWVKNTIEGKTIQAISTMPALQAGCCPNRHGTRSSHLRPRRYRLRSGLFRGVRIPDKGHPFGFSCSRQHFHGLGWKMLGTVDLSSEHD